MGCGKEMMQWVSRGYHGKNVPAVCGQTSVHGDELLCDDCMPYDAEVQTLGTEEGHDGESLTVRYRISFSRVLDEEKSQTAVGNILRRRCGCEHDCCGCFNGWGSIKEKVGPASYLCVGHYARNY